MNSFSFLDPAIREALKECGFDKPTEVQEKAILEVLKGGDYLIIAPTGSGKTEAVLLPLFHKILEMKDRKGIILLYITPLRALNRDLLSRLEFWSKKLGIRIEVRHGDTTQHFRRKQALLPPEMLITTPETLQAILVAKRMREHLKNVKFTVIDEIHEIAESKRGSQLNLALKRLSNIAKISQKIGLSATIGEAKKVGAFISV